MGERGMLFHKIDELKQQISNKENEISSSDGEIRTVLKEIPDSNRETLPKYDSESRYLEEIHNYDQLIKSYQTEILQLEEQLKTIKGDAEKLNIQAEQYESFILREEVSGTNDLCDLIKEYREFEKEYYILKNKVNTQFVKWQDRINAIETETENFVIREPIEELGKI
jgi:chromosome segregation ATPase